MDVFPGASRTRTTRACSRSDVHIRYRLVDDVDEVDARALRCLSSDERARAARFLFRPDRVAFVAAHVLLRETLSRHENVSPAGWSFSQAAQRKPVLADQHRDLDLAFNLSHTHGLVACAIRRGGDVGIDVERLRGDVRPLELAARFFASSELASLEACAEHERAMRFIELWTLKESYVKAIGEGLAYPLDECRFILDGSSVLRFEAPIAAAPHAWQFALFAPSATHRMAVAFREGQAEGVQIFVQGEPATTSPILMASTARR